MIDFGDAYYGYVVMDLAIALMDIAFSKDEFKYIGIPTNVVLLIKDFVNEVKLTMNQFKELMAIAMLRFVYYTYDGNQNYFLDAYHFLMNNQIFE